MVQKGILRAEQGGFRKMHGTVDSIFTLKKAYWQVREIQATEAPKFTRL